MEILASKQNFGQKLKFGPLMYKVNVGFANESTFFTPNFLWQVSPRKNVIL